LLNRIVLPEPAPSQPTYFPPEAAESLTTAAAPASVLPLASASYAVTVPVVAATST